jgi:hypothetical protein
LPAATIVPTQRYRSLQAGDVIRTHPAAAFWGCAVVLRDGIRLEGIKPLCLIGITPLVFQGTYTFDELTGSFLQILEFDRDVRLAPHSYLPRRETCIGFYLDRAHPQLPVIGRVAPTAVYGEPLEDRVGDGSGNGWPLYGPIPAHLGSEAVAAWRSIHDAATFRAEAEASSASFERYEAVRKQQAREKRAQRRSRGGA